MKRKKKKGPKTPRRREFNPGPLRHVHLHPGQVPPAGYTSSRQAELKLGVPREVLAVYAGCELVTPNTPEDRAIRRRVLIKHWAELAGFLPWPMKVRNGREYIPEKLCDDLVTMAKAKNRTARSEKEFLRYCTLAVNLKPRRTKW
jgi:hypothetical protein